MASIWPYKSGYRAQVVRGGVRRTKTFATRREARDWIARTDAELLGGAAAGRVSRDTVAEVFVRYAREVSPKKRGERWEVIRLNAWRNLDWAQKRIGDLTAEDLDRWRDHRLQSVSAGTVRREMTLLGAVLSQSVRPWALIAASPLKDVRKPAPPRRRTRLVTAGELDRLALSAGSDLGHATARVFAAFRLACETGMRSGEILGLIWDHVDLRRRVAHLPQTKNGEARDVPLSSTAVAILGDLEAQIGRRAGPIFDLTPQSRDALWRKLRDRAAVTDLTFHDSRHYAITALSRRLDVLALARMVGHRNINELLTYYEATAEETAKLLD